MLGIDFGTSNSAAAWLQDDGTLIHIPLENGKSTLPTALFFSNEDGQTHYGAAALRAYLSGEEGRLLRSIKSLLGSSLMDEQTVINGRATSLFEVVVMFLRELKRRSEAHLGQPLPAAVLGRPVHFVDDQPERDALAQATLERAARAAGFEHIEFQLEPIAAALDFERSVQQPTTVLVVDIGGGTSDFTVVRVRPDPAPEADRADDILATTGIHIGGTDFDQQLNLRHVMPLLGLGHSGPSGRQVPSSVFYNLSTWHLIPQCYSRKGLHDAAELRTLYADRQLHQRLLRVLQAQEGHRLLAEVEAAKIRCSITGEDTALSLDCIERDLQAQLSAPALGSGLSAQLAAIVDCAHDCVRQAGLSQPDVVYLTGGSSALAPLAAAFAAAFPTTRALSGDRFGSVAAGLAAHGARQALACT